MTADRDVGRTCERCAEIQAAEPLDLIFFFNPGREPTPEDGDRVRALALAMHAAEGHPTEADYFLPICGAEEPGPIEVGTAHTCTLEPDHAGEHDW